MGQIQTWVADRGQRGWLRRFPDETFRVCREGGIQRVLTEIADVPGALGVHDLRGQQPETGVMVLGVVPGEELLAEAASVFLGTKAVRELRAVFQGFEV